LAEAKLVERTLRLTAEIKLRYLDEVKDEARLGTLDRLSGTYHESLRLLEARVREGDAAPLESQLLLVEASRAEAQKRTVAGRIQVALSDPRRLFGLGAGESLVLLAQSGRTEACHTLADLQRQVVEQPPDLRAARLEEERSAAEVSLIEAQGRSDVTLSAQYALTNDKMGICKG
jgi:outer membrane protein TolC